MRRFPRAQLSALPAAFTRIITLYAKCLKSCGTAFRSTSRHFQRASNRQTSTVVVQLRLRESINRHDGSFEARRKNQLRVPTQGDIARLTSKSRANRHAHVEAVARDGQPLHATMPKKLAALRWSRYSYLRALAGFRELLGGYGGVSKREAHIGSIPEQRRQLRAIQLPLGDVAAATSQSFGHTMAHIQGRDALRCGMVGPLGNKSANYLQPTEQGPVRRRSLGYACKAAEAAQATLNRFSLAVQP